MIDYYKELASAERGTELPRDVYIRDERRRGGSATIDRVFCSVWWPRRQTSDSGDLGAVQDSRLAFRLQLPSATLGSV